MLYSEHMFKYQHQHRDQENWVQILCSVPRDCEKNENMGYRVTYIHTVQGTQKQNKSLASITISSGGQTLTKLQPTAYTKKQKYLIKKDKYFIS